MSSNMALFLVLPTVIILGNGVSLGQQDFSNVQMHPACEKKDFCLEQTPDYPHERIEKLLVKEKLGYEDSSTTEHRHSYDDKTPCKANSTVKPIYQIRDVNKKVRYVVQTKRFEQIIRLEWCENKGEITEDREDLPFSLRQLHEDSLKAFCVESYTNYKFLVLSLDGEKLEEAKVGDQSIPVCCKCNITDVWF